ncbi:hypothetical protein [Enterobacter sp. Bisph1]|uniref:hypothetical protein n=1 Tax=Enterobacter sp. Bisph1 TaxID=1274399 RepID=UPI00057BD87A|nr:hypothetical protein [Enterobacter sp. Bisph1]
MTEKIKKLIGKALNNSSANEAAQALKMAAATMQSEGVNPNAFLVSKGTADERAVLEAEYAELKRAFDQQRRKNAQLENALKAAAGNPAALREAQEQASHWHRTSQEQGQKLGALRGRITRLLVLGIVACTGAYIIGGAVAHHSSDALQLQLSDKDKQIATLKNQLQTATTGKPTKRRAEAAAKNSQAKTPNVFDQFDSKDPVDARKEIYTLKAECINGRGKKLNPAWTVNTRKFEVDESTKLLANGYSLSLSDKAVPVNGQRFKLTYPDGSVINCSVVDAR